MWPMYECADLTLLSSSSFSALNMTIPCENQILTTQTRSKANPTLTQLQADAAAEEAAAAQASISAHAASFGYTQGGAGGSKLTATEAGVVGAMTTLGVAVIALLAARLVGVVAFGRKAVKQQRQEQVPRVSTT
jgi:predicted amino acid dehydrogenase